MKAIVSVLIVTLLLVTACQGTGLPSGLGPSVETSVAQAPTTAAGLGGALNAAQTEAVRAQTLAAPLGTQAAGAFSTGAPLAQTAVAAAQTAVKTAVVPLGSITPPAGASAIQVKLTENKIDMPASLRTGVFLFMVNNAGTTEHNFAIQGSGIDKKLDNNLKPGETAPLVIQLPPGNYLVFDPVGRNRETGLALVLAITAQ